MSVSSPRPRAARLGAIVASTLVVSLAVLTADQSAWALMPASRADGGSATTRLGDVASHDKAAARRAKPITVKVDPHLFGVHDSSLNSLSRAGTGAIRLWDTGTTWADLQPTSGPPNYARLDQVVRAAHTRGVEVTLVVAMTPAWAAADPGHTAPTDAPDPAAFRAYLAGVMQHYKNFFGPGKRGIANYQIWNEANISTFWTGTPAQMAQLVQAAWQVRQQVDRGAHLIGPSMVARLGYQQKYLAKFYTLKVGGKPVWKYVDALGFSLYPLDTARLGRTTRPATPEDSIALLRLVRGFLAKDKVPASLPVWNNEVNYGLHAGATAGTPAAPIPASRQVAFLMRTYLLNAAAGVKRVFWYSYDLGTLSGGGTIANTLLTDPADRAGGSLTPAGKAFTRVRSWMAGTLVGTSTHRPCAADRKGTYTCLVRYRHGVGRIYWNPYRTGTVTLVRSATQKVDELGKAHRVTGGTKLKVGANPVLVKSST